MPIPSFIDKPVTGAKGAIKKVPKKVWVIALGGGVVIYIYTRHRSNTQAVSNPATTSDGTPVDQSSNAASPTGGLGGDAGLPGVDLPSPDLSGDVSSDPGTGLTLQFITNPAPDGGAGSDTTPGGAIKSNTTGVKRVTSPIKTLGDLPYKERAKIHQERKEGKVDRYGRTPTERAAARANPGIRHQLRQRLDRQRAHKAGGGPPKRGSHGHPKNPPKRTPPAEHHVVGTVSNPKGTPPVHHHKRKGHS